LSTKIIARGATYLSHFVAVEAAYNECCGNEDGWEDPPCEVIDQGYRINDSQRLLVVVRRTLDAFKRTASPVKHT